MNSNVFGIAASILLLGITAAIMVSRIYKTTNNLRAAKKRATIIVVCYAILIVIICLYLIPIAILSGP